MGKSLMGNMLGLISGGNELKLSENLLFDKVIGVRGIIDGVGVSTLVQNMAISIADTTSNTICVVDTHMLDPAQEFLLGIQGEVKKDLLDYAKGGISEVVYRTRYSNVYLAMYQEPELPEMLASKECQRTISDFFEEVKSFFDIVIVDLSHEPTHARAESAIRCNRIYTVLTPSLACLSVMQKSLNEAASLAVPLHKMHKCILNQTVSDVNSGVESAIKKYDLNLLASIPYSEDIARLGVTGERIWGSFSRSRAIGAFNTALDIIKEDCMERNDLNQQKDRTAPLGDAVEVVKSENINIVGEDFTTGVQKRTGFFGRKSKVRKQDGTLEGADAAMQDNSFDLPQSSQASPNSVQSFDNQSSNISMRGGIGGSVKQPMQNQALNTADNFVQPPMNGAGQLVASSTSVGGQSMQQTQQAPQQMPHGGMQPAQQMQQGAMPQGLRRRRLGQPPTNNDNQ